MITEWWLLIVANLWKARNPEVRLSLQVATERLRNVSWVDRLLRRLLELLLLLLERALLLEASLLLPEVLLEVERLLGLLLLERLLRPLLERLLLSWRLRWPERAQRIPELGRVEERVDPVDERLEERA